MSSDTIVQDGDFIGGINDLHADGSEDRIAGIYGVVDGTPGADDTGTGELLFEGTADTATIIFANYLGSPAM